MERLEYFIRKRWMLMFKLINGNSKKATVDMARCGDWCIICDNLEDNDQCTNCDGYKDPCIRNDIG